MIFNFPRVRFVETAILYQQIDHLRSEVAEVEAALPDYKNMEHTASELMDVIHSAESALRILQERFNLDLHRLRADVEKKNRVRGYYGV